MSIEYAAHFNVQVEESKYRYEIVPRRRDTPGNLCERKAKAGITRQKDVRTWAEEKPEGENFWYLPWHQVIGQKSKTPSEFLE